MGYSNFKTMRMVCKKFDTDVRLINLFTGIKPVEPSDWLSTSLELAKTMPLSNEKTKSERVVSPILLEIVQKYKDSVTLFSGESLEIDPAKDLSGECDFFFGLHPPKPFIDSPIISLVEAKDEDMDYGIAQCAAQLYGAKLFNEMDGKDIPVLYGCATDGIEWKFLRFENNVFYIDNQIYTNLQEILGVFHHIIQSYL